MLVDNVFWGSLDTYAVTSGQLEVTIPLARLGQHTLEIRNRPERNKAAVPTSATSFKLEFVQMETLYDGQTLQYSYDDLSRLLAADYFAAWDAVNPVRDYTFGYDVAGNRLSEVVNVDGTPFSSQTHTYDAANRISNAGCAYNDAGQMTADGTLSYSWDRAGRLLGAGDSSYAYNGLGQRVQQTVSGVVTDYLLDVQPGLAKVIAATTGANTERFVHERGLLSQQDSAGDWQWMVKDGLDSVRGVVDDGFDAVGSRHFAPYGVAYDEQGAFSVPFAFTGEMLDANGLQYHRARYLNPALGVFPSLDPVEGTLERIMSINHYSYAEGRVPNWSDPSGADPLCGIPNYLVAFPYNRSAAAAWASDNSRRNYLMPPPINRVSHVGFRYHYLTGETSSENIYVGATGSATFVSEALWFGGNLPMTLALDDDPLAPSQCAGGSGGYDGGWRVCFEDYIEKYTNIRHNEYNATSNWKGHLQLKRYIRDIGGTQLPQEFVSEGIPDPGPPYVFSTGPLIDYNTGEITNSDRLEARLDKLVNVSVDGNMVSLRAGDYMFIPSSAHGLLVVGWGPPNLCADVIENENTGQFPVLEERRTTTSYVPYVADYSYGVGGWTQDPRPRPFYCTAVNDGVNPLGRWDTTGGWEFYTIPDVISIPSERLYLRPNTGLRL